jgi:hypothetical protein
MMFWFISLCSIRTRRRTNVKLLFIYLVFMSLLRCINIEVCTESRDSLGLLLENLDFLWLPGTEQLYHLRRDSTIIICSEMSNEVLAIRLVCKASNLSFEIILQKNYSLQQRTILYIYYISVLSPNIQF